MGVTQNLTGDSPFLGSPSLLSSTEGAQRSQRLPNAENDSTGLTPQGSSDSRKWSVTGHGTKWPRLLSEFSDARGVLEGIFRRATSTGHNPAASPVVPSELLASRLLIQSAITQVESSLQSENYVLQVEAFGKTLPRSYVAAKSYLAATCHEFNGSSFLAYMDGVQERRALQFSEIWLLSPFLQLELLCQLATEITKAPCDATPETSQRLKSVCESLARVRGMDWSSSFNALSMPEGILMKDPAGAYPKMDLSSRSAYWHAIQELSRYSDASEEEVASLALRRAQESQERYPDQSRDSIRFTHVGYYLVSEGRQSLESEIAYRPHGAAWIRRILLRRPEVYYFLSIEFAIFGILFFLLNGVRTGVPFIAASLLLLLPASEAAIETINQLIRAFLPPRAIPRFDFEDGIPKSCSTVVAVPALLNSQEQVEHLVRALEIRYLNNVDDALYFALLTDLPDSATAFDEKDQLAILCSALIERLNQEYSRDGVDRFFHLHRNRIFNATDETWMGWERKRGKLLDFNEFIRGGEDRFPVKSGNVAQLRGVRYVITLDADTQLPRGAAARLVGAMAHPLNRAVVDPITRTVTAGYGVLQPRIGVSVQSVNRSRLAHIYSGQTGLDIYTYAVSDVYQDLFGEGIFTGKGIYDPEVFQEVLRNRFPSNAILSHDLIEGVYARTGLVSDIELIDDFPSHFSAHSRRKHRWVRGDWQIMRWLFRSVPDAHGETVGNPLSLLSRWKILDNLRRSVIEAATFVLFLACWFYLPGSPTLWTATAVALLLIPSYVQVLLALAQQWSNTHKRATLGQLFSDFVTTQVNVLVFLAFLPHQALVTLDAIARTLIRLLVTHQKLLEWETAAQSEIDARRNTPVDKYLKLIPLITLLIAAGLLIFRPGSLPAAAPILFLWLLSRPAAKWLDRPLRSTKSLLSPDEETFLRHAALKTWRFFGQYSNEKENWLIPDNIQGTDNRIAHRVSTTNLGLLFNSQLAACYTGIQTIPRFLIHAENTMATVKRLPRFHGHLANWYDTQTLEPLNPTFLSSVDNGNLVCCLWALKQGSLALMEQPLFQPQMFHSIVDHLDIASEAMDKEGFPADQLSALEYIRIEARRLGANPRMWCEAIPRFDSTLGLLRAQINAADGDASWWIQEAQNKLRDFQDMVSSLAPWFLPEGAVAQAALPKLFGTELIARMCINSLRDVYAEILQAPETPELYLLRTKMACSTDALDKLHHSLLNLAANAHALVEDMDFSLFYDKGRRAISIGFDVTASKLQKSCYDLLASEARSAIFVSIAKNDVPQEAWFQLGRVHTRYSGRNVLLSWTGTMFEYLMPTLWLRHFPNTFLENSLQAAVDCQRAYVAPYGIPWGISEGACPASRKDELYGYQAFGLPQLALSPDSSKRIIITPYAGALALNIQPRKALENLRAMADLGWLGSFGFYESVEFHADARDTSPYEIVHSWMAHHQGMILMSICNALNDSVFSSLFHKEVRVESAERLLHERPLSPYAQELLAEAPCSP